MLNCFHTCLFFFIRSLFPRFFFSFSQMTHSYSHVQSSVTFMSRLRNFRSHEHTFSNITKKQTGRIPQVSKKELWCVRVANHAACVCVCLQLTHEHTSPAQHPNMKGCEQVVKCACKSVCKYAHLQVHTHTHAYMPLFVSVCVGVCLI